MKLQRTIIVISGIFIAIGAAHPAAAGPEPTCELTIEINALRGGSPTVTVGDTKSITTKARIEKGTAEAGTTIDTTLRIDAQDGAEVLQSRTTFPVTLEVGKGGTGRTFEFDITQCKTGSVYFIATFSGEAANGALCEATRTLRKTCK